MGNYHIVSISDDGINVVQNQDTNPGLAQALGEAVLKVCLDHDFAMVPRGRERITSAPVLRHGNCVSWIDEKHHTEACVYYAPPAFVRPISDCTLEELEEARKLLNDELQRRRAGA